MPIELFQYSFMQRALVVGCVIGVVAPLVGQYLVVRRYSLLADTLAHVSLFGAALGLALGFAPVPTAAVVAMIAALGIEQLRARRALQGESLLALVLSGSLALAVIVTSLRPGSSIDLFTLLFGSIATVSPSDVWLISGVGIAVVALLFGLRRQLFILSFDQELAIANGLPVRLLNGIFVVMLACVVALAMRIVGGLLIGALLVVPVVTAFQWQRGFRATAGIAVAYSVVAVIAGLIISFYADIPSGATIAVCALAFFLFTLALRRSQ